MISNAAQIIAQVIDVKQMDKLRGQGVVEKKIDDTTYQLRFPTGKIAVTVTEGSLSPGTPVQVKHKGGEIILQPLPAQIHSADSIVLSGAKQDTTNAKILHELLTFLSSNPELKYSGSTEQDSISQLTRLTARLQQVKQTENFTADLKIIAQKIIKSVPVQLSPSEAKIPAETKSLVITFQNKLIDWCCTQQNSIKLTTQPPQGFLYFDTGREAINWFVKTQPQIPETVVKELEISRTEPVIIRTVNAANGETLAIVMNKEQGIQALDADLHAEERNPLWNMLSTENILSLLEVKGHIPAETIEAIDKILQFYGTAAPMQTSQSTPSNELLIQQWITLMVENDALLQKLGPFAPVHPAETITKSLENEIINVLPKGAVQLEVIQNATGDTSLNETRQPVVDPVTQAFRAMGYNLEHELVSAASSDSPEQKEALNTVKAALLSLLQALPHTAITNSAAEETGKAVTTPPTPALVEMQTLVDEIKTLIAQMDGKQPAEPVAPGAQPLPSYSPEQLQRQIQSAIQSFITALENNTQNLVDQIQEFTSGQKDIPPETLKLLAQVSEMVKQVHVEVKLALNEYLPAADTTKPETVQVKQPEEIITQSRPAIEKLLHTLLQLIEKNSQDLQQHRLLLNSYNSTEPKQAVSTFIDNTSDLLTRLKTMIASLLQSVQKQDSLTATVSLQQHELVKQMIQSKINSFIRPLETMVNTLLTTLQSGTSQPGSTGPVRTVTDSFYNIILQSKNTLMNELAHFTQNMGKNIEQNKGVTPAQVHNKFNELNQIVSKLHNDLATTIAKEGSSLLQTLQNTINNFTEAAGVWQNQQAPLHSELAQNISSMVQDIKENLIHYLPQLSPDTEEFSKKIETSVNRLIQNAISETVSNARGQASRLSAFLQSTELNTLKSGGNIWQPAAQMIESATQTLEADIRNVITESEEKFIQQLNALSRSQSTPQTTARNMQSVANRLSETINQLFNNTVKEIESLFEKISLAAEKNPEELLNRVSQAVSQLKQEIEQLIRTLTRQIEHAATRSERPLETALPENIRQQVETTLTRLESLQLLAKPTPTSEGQQQVLSLPMKIGEEWTSVNILFIKKRSKKKGKSDSGHYSVQMHVEPSQCGAIRVDMNYYLKQKLSVRIEFDKEASRQWFRKNRDNLINALKEQGISSIALSLESPAPPEETRKKKRPLTPAKNGRQSNIDINA